MEYVALDSRMDRTGCKVNSVKPYVVCEANPGRKALRMIRRYTTLAGAQAAAAKRNHGV